MPTTATLPTILAQVRSALDADKYQFIPRRKNMHTLAQLGLTVQDAKNEIYTLTPAHYHSGPMIDRDRPTSDHLWVFKKRVEGEILYIKFKILYQEDGSVKVLSFHIDETL